MKGIPNAIDAYNSALNIDPKDFRAWYGLGQAYELQGMIQFSLNYFSKAVKSRPRDYRMWNALAESYKKLDRNEESTRCYEHSDFYKDVEGIALFNLGKMYNVLGYEEKAVSCFEEILSPGGDQPKTTDENVGYIYIHLVNYYKKKHNYTKALRYANSLFDRNGNTREEA
jgi:anaphase-promoting complex subunit 8